jgi:hypothetical protein
MGFVHDVMGCMNNVMGGMHDVMGSMNDLMGSMHDRHGKEHGVMGSMHDVIGGIHDFMCGMIDFMGSMPDTLQDGIDDIMIGMKYFMDSMHDTWVFCMVSLVVCMTSWVVYMASLVACMTSWGLYIAAMVTQCFRPLGITQCNKHHRTHPHCSKCSRSFGLNFHMSTRTFFLFYCTCFKNQLHSWENYLRIYLTGKVNFLHISHAQVWKISFYTREKLFFNNMHVFFLLQKELFPV